MSILTILLTWNKQLQAFIYNIRISSNSPTHSNKTNTLANGLIGRDIGALHEVGAHSSISLVDVSDENSLLWRPPFLNEEVMMIRCGLA